MTGHPINDAKISRPELAEIFVRCRLIDELNPKPGRLGVFITAPAGYGKTTLLASYLEHTGRPSIWYRIDSSDADPAAFFYYLGMAAKRAAPGSKTTMPLLTADHLPSLRIFARTFFEALFARLGGSGCLVLDDYHLLPQESPLQGLIAENLASLPKGRNLIIAGRQAPPPAFAGLIVNRRLHCLDWEALKLSPLECRGIMRLQGIGAAPRGSVKQLMNLTDGWVAGVILLLQSGDWQHLERDISELESNSLMFDYFVAEIFQRLVPETREFLLKTSLLSHMTADAAAALAENAGSAKILPEMAANNYFTYRRRGQPDYYEYHTLFRAFLLARADDAFRGERLQGLLLKAAEIERTEGRPDAAADLYGQAGAAEALETLICEHAPALLAQGRFSTLQSWIERISEARRECSPWLQYWLAQCLLPFDPAAALKRFAAAFELFRPLDDTKGLLMAWCGAVDTYIISWDRFTELDPWIVWLDDWTNRDSTFPDPVIEGYVACSMANALMYRQPFRRDVIDWFDRAWVIARNCNDPDLLIRTAFCFSFIGWNLRMGAFDKSRIMLDALSNLVDQDHISPMLKLLLKLYEAMSRWYDIRPGECLAALDEAFELAKAADIHHQDANIHTIAAYHALAMGDPEQAAISLERMAANLLICPHLFNKAHYLYLRAWESFIRRDSKLAIEYCEAAFSIAIEAGCEYRYSFGNTSYALVLFDDGRVDEALQAIDLAIDEARHLRSPLAEFHALFAAAYFKISEASDDSLSELRAALSLGRLHGFEMSTLWWHSDMFKRVFSIALDAGIEPDFVEACIHRRNFIPDIPPLDCKAWPWPVKIITFGGFELIKSGQTLEFGRKAPKKSLDLLKAVIALGGVDVPETALIDALWPDSDGDAGRSAFSTTLGRLRHLVGEEVLTLCDGRVSLDRRRCWTDVWAFEDFIVRAKAAERTGDAEASLRFAKDALALYQSHFLATDTDAAWALSKRGRLRTRLIFFLTSIGNRLRSTGQWHDALKWYRRALEFDPLAEAFYQGLMQSYQQLGCRAEAVRTYRHCREMLELHLGIEPSDVTERLYRQLLDD